MASKGGNGWGLEVVRGREIGRVFPLGPAPVVLGNALNGEPGIDLGSQEGTSPRRMAARQARLERSAAGMVLRDLDSPGGTFVNRQRVLPGQAFKLGAGDLIQLGAVQLRLVVESSAPTQAPVARLGALVAPFTLASGDTCRTWDEFLTVSAKSWTALREELISGRLGAFLKAAGRDDLAPAANSTKSPDERLDEWLGRLPTTRAVEPDLEVHPGVVRVRGLAGGGLTRAKIVVTNTGYRLLRSTLRFEPPETSWVHASPGFADRFTTAETTEIPLDVQIPETLETALSAFMVIESNGGTRRVEIRVEPQAKAEPLPPPPTGAEARMSPGDLLAGWSPRQRAMKAGALAVLLRLSLIIGGGAASFLNFEDASKVSLAGSALILAVLGATAAGGFARRRGEPSDVVPALITGAVTGILLAAFAVAACRAIEPTLGLDAMPALACFVWGGLGVLAGLGSYALVPSEQPKGQTP